ncbi:peptidoglycan-binding protein [Micromonospora chokoriensis]
MTSQGGTVRRAIRIMLWCLVTAAVAGGVTAAALGLRWTQGDPQRPRAEAATTATVTRQTLTDAIEVDGKVAYGTAMPLVSRAQGIVTWLPRVGTVLGRGDPVLRADDRPVVLLFGNLPMYRELKVGVEGSDVRQLESNLRALDYFYGTPNEKFDKATEVAVKRWQKRLKVTESGIVGAGAVIYTPEQLRVAAASLRVGAPATGDVLTVTTTKQVVTATVKEKQAGLAKAGNTVTVHLPGGRTTKGTVAGAANAATAAGAQGSAPAGGEITAPPEGGQGGETVVVSIADQAALKNHSGADVQVRYVVATRADVLTVPVTALLALAEGGFGLEIQEGATTRILTVKTGLAAQGRIEVSGAGIDQGTTVVTAS